MLDVWHVVAYVCKIWEGLAQSGMLSMVRYSTVCLVWLGTEYFGTVWYAWYGYPAVPSEVASSFHWQQQQLKAAG